MTAAHRRSTWSRRFTTARPAAPSTPRPVLTWLHHLQQPAPPLEDQLAALESEIKRFWT